MSVFIKIDCGYHRAGISPADKRLLPLARLIHAHPNLHFQGVLTHGGHSYDCKGLDAIRQVAEQERSLIVEAAERSVPDGLPVHVVSVGSTPTMVAVEDLSGVTEMRPGNYALFDQTTSRYRDLRYDRYRHLGHHRSYRGLPRPQHATHRCRSPTPL